MSIIYRCDIWKLLISVILLECCTHHSFAFLARQFKTGHSVKIRQNTISTNYPSFLFSSRPNYPDISELLGDEPGYEIIDPILSPEYGTDDEEIISALRLEKLLDNDRWQSCQFRDRHCGTWEGNFEIYTPHSNIEESFSFINFADGKIKTNFLPTNSPPLGVNVSMHEVFECNNLPNENVFPEELSKLLLMETTPSLNPSDFRVARGNQNIGNAFTLVKSSQEKEGSSNGVDSYVTEIGLTESSSRVRVRFAYGVINSDERSTTVDGETTYLSLLGFAVIRESRLSSQLPVCSEDLGTGIYDPQASGPNFACLDLKGRLSLMFPLRLLSNGGGDDQRTRTVFTVQWQGEESMIYQADRKIASLSGGALKTFELTEIRSEDASIYMPQYPAGNSENR